MYVREVDGQELTFGHSGCLVDQSFIFYDRQTNSHWVQATGRCIEGKLAGKQLQSIPATQTTWGQWKAMHPETLVLAKPPELVERYRSDHGHSAYFEEHGTKFGLAVFTEDRAKLYPFDELEKLPVLRDKLGDQEVLIVFHPATRTAIAFDPRRDGEPSDFELAEMTDDDVRLMEKQSGTIWSGLTGEKISADGSQEALRQLRSNQFVLENWWKHFPDSPIYGAPAEPR